MNPRRFKQCVTARRSFFAASIAARNSSPKNCQPHTRTTVEVLVVAAGIITSLNTPMKRRNTPVATASLATRTRVSITTIMVIPIP